MKKVILSAAIATTFAFPAFASEFCNEVTVARQYSSSGLQKYVVRSRKCRGAVRYTPEEVMRFNKARAAERRANAAERRDRLWSREKAKGNGRCSWNELCLKGPPVISK